MQMNFLLSDILSPAFWRLLTHQKMNVLFRMPNAKLSGGAAVRLSAGLERGGAAKDEHEKNRTLGTPHCFSNSG